MSGSHTGVPAGAQPSQYRTSCSRAPRSRTHMPTNPHPRPPWRRLAEGHPGQPSVHRETILLGRETRCEETTEPNGNLHAPSYPGTERQHGGKGQVVRQRARREQADGAASGGAWPRPRTACVHGRGSCAACLRAHSSRWHHTCVPGTADLQGPDGDVRGAEHVWREDPATPHLCSSEGHAGKVGSANPCGCLKASK